MRNIALFLSLSLFLSRRSDVKKPNTGIAVSRGRKGMSEGGNGAE